MFEDSPDGFVKKWTEGIAKKGFAAIPNCLLLCQKELGVSGEEAMVLLHLLAYYWNEDSKIYPSAATIARSLGKTESTIRRRTRVLEKKEFLVRNYRQGNSNIYDITPTINKLRQHLSDCKWGKHGRSLPSARMSRAPQAYMHTNKENQTILTDNNFMSEHQDFEHYLKHESELL